MFPSAKAVMLHTEPKHNLLLTRTTWLDNRIYRNVKFQPKEKFQLICRLSTLTLVTGSITSLQSVVVTQ